MPDNSQYDSLGQFIGTSSKQVNGGTLYEGTQNGSPWQRFVQGSITPKDLAPTSDIVMPPQPNINSGAGVISGGNAEINALAGTTIQPTPTAPQSSINDMLASLGVNTPPTDLSGTYESSYKDSGAYQQEQALAAKARAVTAAKQEFDTYNSQLKGIEDKAKQQSLILEGQNKAAGVNARVATLLNREQQEINRQAAIEALPIQGLALAAQAKLIAAQGDEANAQNVYQMALNKFDKVFQMKMDYEDKMYNYKLEQQNKIFDYLTKKETEQLQTIQKEDDRKYQEGRDNLNLAQNWAAEAIKAGQGGLAAEFAGLDPKSADFAQKFATIQGKLNIQTPAQLSKIDMENKLAQAGYVKINSPAQLAGLNESQILRIKDDNGIETIFKRPVEAVKASKKSQSTKNEKGEPIGDDVSDFDYARQVMDANPNISDAELKSGLLELVNKKEIKLSVTEINSLIAERKEKATTEAEANKPQSFSQDWFKTKIDTARSNDFSDTEIVDYIIKNFDINELFKTAKEAGFAKWYTGKETDIKRYIESLL